MESWGLAGRGEGVGWGGQTNIGKPAGLRPVPRLHLDKEIEMKSTAEHPVPDIVLDIETYADVSEEQLKHIKAGIKPDGRIKDPAKIKADIAKKQTEVLDKAALSPRTGRVVCVGIGIRKLDDAKMAWWEFAAFLDEVNEEEKLLRIIDDTLADNIHGHLITFDGRRFDLPFMAARAMKHGMALRYKWPLGYHPLHIDLFELLGKEGGLDAWAMGLLGRSKTTAGSEIAGMVEGERWNEIREHCLEDIRMTAELFDRLERVARLERR